MAEIPDTIAKHENNSNAEERLAALITNPHELEIACLASKLAIDNLSSGNHNYSSTGINAAAIKLEGKKRKALIVKELEQQLNHAFRLAVNSHINQHGHLSIGYHRGNDITSVLSETANIGFAIKYHDRERLSTFMLEISPIKPLANILPINHGEWSFHVHVHNEDQDEFTYCYSLDDIYDLAMSGPLDKLTENELECILSDVKQLVTEALLVNSDP